MRHNNGRRIAKEILMSGKRLWTVNNIETEGARMISEALTINSTLTALHLRGEMNDNCKRIAKGVKVINECEQTTTLKQTG